MPSLIYNVVMKNDQQNPSTVSSQSTTTFVNPVPPLRTARRPQKDYAAALGTLQSRYGTSGHIPNPKKKPSNKLPQSTHRPLHSVSEAPSLQITLTPTSTNTEGSVSASNSGNRHTRKSKGTMSFLKAIFKGKNKEKDLK